MTATITALEAQKRNTERISVYLDGEFAFGLPSSEAARLRVGQTLSADEIAALRQVDAVSRATDRAVRLLARRPYSTTEIRRNLASHEVAPSVIEDVIRKLERLEYIDDLAFARYWIENRERFKPRSPRALRYELQQKGIATDLIETALADLDPHASARRAAEGKLRSLRGQTRDTFRAKLSAFLARRGFGFDEVRQVIDQISAELEETQPDFFANDEE